MVALVCFSLGCALLMFVHAGINNVRFTEIPLWMSSAGARNTFASVALVAPFLPMAFAPLAGVRWWLGLPIFVGAWLAVVVAGVFIPLLLNIAVRFVLACLLILVAVARVVACAAR